MEIIANDISKSFDHKTKVLENLNLKIESKSLTTLLGLSGCGKTTLLRIIAGLEKSDTGSIFLGDKIVFDKKTNIDVEPFKRNIAFVFQDFALWPNMTVLQNVIFAISNRNKTSFKDFFSKHKENKKEIEEKALNALRLVKMDSYAKRLPNELSGGQKQRVAIARAISISPDVILFDEPLSALDALLREEMRIEIRNLVKNLGITSIFVTHDQEEAMSISDSIIIMNQGRIVEQGKPEEIYWHPKNKFVANFIGKASFVDDNHFLRPEDISFDDKKEVEVDVNVINSQCLGGSYHIVCKDEYEHLYYLNSNKNIFINSNLKIYYSKDSLKEVR